MAAAAGQAEDAPDSLDPGSLRAFVEGCRDWDEQRLLSAWLADPGRDDAADERVRELCAESAALWASMPRADLPHKSSKERIPLIREALELAPDSVLLRVLLGEAYADTDGDEHIGDLLAVYRATTDSDPLPIRRLYIACTVRWHAEQSDDPQLASAARQVIFETLTALLLDPPEDQLEQRYCALYADAIAKWSTSELDLSEPAGAAAAQADDPWLALLVAARAHRTIGWNARGSGFANTVEDDAWAVFHHRIELARPLLIRAYDMRPQAPEAATMMIDIAKSGSEGLPEINTWFGRVVSAQPTWMPALPEFAWAIRPRWGGSVGRMLKLAGWIARSAKPGDELSEYLFELLGMVMEDTGSTIGHWRDDKLAGAVNVLSRRHIDAGIQPELWLQRRIGVAWARGEWDRAAQAASGVGPDFWTSFNDFRVHGHDVRESILLRTASKPMSLRHAMAAMDARELAEAESEFERALEAESLSEEMRVAILNRLTPVRWYREYLEQGRVELRAEPGMHGWRLWQGSMRADGERIFLGANEGNAWIQPAFDPGPRYELVVTVEAPSGPGFAWSRVVVGETWARARQAWTTISARWHDSSTRMRYRFSVRQSPSLSEPLADGVVTYRVVCYDGDLLVEADGERLYRGPAAMGYRAVRMGTGFWLSAWIAGQGRETAYSGIVFRRLEERPDELEGPVTRVMDRDS